MKLHPLTALREAGRRALAIGSTTFFVVVVGGGALDLVDLGLGLAIVPVAALLGAAYGVAYYLRYEYELAGGTLSIRSGVVGRREREIPLRRVQNVDVQQSLLQRVLGLAAVSVETAGGGATEAVLNFVSKSEAERLQREIREGKRSVAPGSEEAPADAETGADEAAVRTLFEIGDVELGLYALTSFRPSSLLVLVFAAPFGWEAASAAVLRVARPLGGPTEIDPAALATVAGLTLVVVGTVLAALTTWALSGLLTLLGYYGFALGRAGDDLVYERGLLRRYSGSIPLSKVQTLTLVEHVLARRFGYAGLRVETAGYSAGGGGGGQDSGRPASAVPLAARDRALALARSIEPFGDLEFTRPPKVARRRYAARYLGVLLVLTAVAYGIGRLLAGVGVSAGLEYWLAPLLAAPIAPVAAHLKWANRGYHLGDDHVALREGFWRRRTRVVPYYRLQTVETQRTLFQRRLDLASVVADTASSGSLLGSAAVAHDVATGTGRRLHGELRERLSAAVSK
jgi:putative membrane protein